jgi:hypothetical protein
VWLRWVLCEAAQTAKRHPQFAATFQRIAKRRGKKIATTAVARKLLTRGAILQDIRCGQPAPGDHLHPGQSASWTARQSMIRRQLPRVGSRRATPA